MPETPNSARTVPRRTIISPLVTPDFITESLYTDIAEAIATPQPFSNYSAISPCTNSVAGLFCDPSPRENCRTQGPSTAPNPPEGTAAPRPARRKRIKALGVELEGGWRTRPPTATIHRDGSVTVEAPFVGEVSSEPLPDLSSAEEWVRTNYPQLVNNSCGLHVHVSTNELNYSRLMEPEFCQFFEARMAEFLSQGLANNRPGFDLLRQRFQGLNRFCQKKFIPEQQLFLTDPYGNTATHPRYAQLNFCYIRHGTLECRLFPCFPSVDDGVAAVKAFYDTVFDYLGQFKSIKDEPSTLVIPLSEITSQ